MLKRALKRLINLAGDARLLGPASAMKGVLANYGSGLIHVNLPQGRVKLRRSSSDYAVLRQVFGLKEYAIGNKKVEEKIQSRYSAMLAAGQVPVIIDAGANVGLAALWFGHQYPKSKIIAIEPDPENFRILIENVGSSDLFIPMQAAVGSLPGSVSLVEAGRGWAVQTERTRGGGTVPIVTISDALASVPNGAPFIVKIDIEGFESDLFKTNLEWLDETFAVFIEPHDWLMPTSDTSRSLQKAFGERDFNVYLRGENLLYVRRIAFSCSL